METTKLKKFAQQARTTLIDTVNTKLAFVLADGSSARRENPKAVKKLEDEIVSTSEDQVVEKVAYIWFNRFIALRFMDVNRYTKLGIVSPEEEQSQPVILSDAKMGHIDDSLVSDTEKEKVLALLENRTPSQDPQGEAYKLLVVSACNYYSHAMPFLFEKISDYTELLMPDDLLSGTSILDAVREAMTSDVCQDVEVIGWLYQFYISEKKDKVFEGIKKNQKVTPENIPAATQLFTPHWIVQYMVENSLGRLWMLNNPDSKLIEKMEYYIKPETPESDYLEISSPQELKICDPACGSGHILVYAFDLLYEIYKEEGIDESSIAELILKNNLYGIEIDERASELAAFALAMKAASRSGSKRRFFRKPIEVNICKLETIKFDDEEIASYMDAVGRDLFTSDLQTTLKQFEEADNFGSLIQPAVKDVTATLQTLKEKDVSHDLFLAPTHEKVLQVLEQADYLSQKYNVVVANPPYMGANGMNKRLAKFLSDNYKNGKSDLMTSFIQRTVQFTVGKGFTSSVTLDSWMFLSSYINLRKDLLQNTTIDSLVHVGWNCFPDGHVYNRGVAFVFKNDTTEIEGKYFNLSDVPATVNKNELFLSRLEKREALYFKSQKDFFKIPDNIFAYWISDDFLNVYKTSKNLDYYAKTRQGLATADNNRFLRFWSEISFSNIGLNLKNRTESSLTNCKWFPYNKGGEYRKWYGNQHYVINWENDGQELEDFKPRSVIRSPNTYFKESLSWSKVTSSGFALRYFPNGFIYDVAGCSIFINETADYPFYLGLINSNIMTRAVSLLSPTINFEVGQMANFPIYPKAIETKYKTEDSTMAILDISKKDWNSYEGSWNFDSLALLDTEIKNTSLKESYNSLKELWKSQINKTKKLEEDNNQIFIKAYELENELDPEVPLKEITLTCNPYYRYDAKKSKEALDELQLADTMKEYISYAVGVMLGRYSLDHDGLHIADVDVSVDEANAKFNVQTPTFEADNDNVIPILDGDWFTDDISERFLQFVKVTFGEESYEGNVQFIEDAIGKSIRKYFVKDFYPDHVKRYKKRPIYWMFNSPKGSFQALIYMHRYKSDTVSVILNDYLRDYITKLEATKENLEAIGIKADANKSEKVKALKEIEKIKKMIIELVDYEKDIMYPLATQKIEIDLDDGVKHNYPLFGKALKKVTGLS